MQGEHAYARDPATPGALHTISVGLAGVGPPPWTTLSTAGHAQTEFFVGQGRLLTRQAERVVTLRGIPDELAIDPALCATTGGFFPPVASTPLPDGSQLSITPLKKRVLYAIMVVVVVIGATSIFEAIAYPLK